MKIGHRKIFTALAAGVAMVVLPLFSVFAYEEVTVTDGGSLTGRVTLSGDLPRPKGYNLTTLPDAIYCGRISDGHGWRLLQPFHVGDDGAFRDIVVFIQELEKGKPFGAFTPPRIEAMDCRFLPFVTVVRDRQDVTVVNMDPAMHDIQAYETSHLGPRVLFNVPLPISERYPKQAGLSNTFHKHFEGKVMTQTVKMSKSRRVFVMQCGFHAYMESWAVAVENPYYAVTAKDGSFTITDIPPGSYNVLVWHPYIAGGAAKEYPVTIKAKGSTTLNVDIPAPTGRLYANEMVDNPYMRYSITAETQSSIKPTLEKQTY